MIYKDLLELNTLPVTTEQDATNYLNLQKNIMGNKFSWDVL